jgi:hypothetical protein
MKPAWPPMALWGAFCAVLTLVGVIFFGTTLSTPGLLGGAAASALVLALGLAVTRRSVQVEGGGTDPEGSPATVWLAISLALMATGAALGPWLALIGGGMAAVGAVGVARELRAQRQAGRAAGAGGGGSSAERGTRSERAARPAGGRR